MTEFDYIIAGGGSAGCVLAARLSEDPDVSVLLVEAGGRDKSFLYHWPAGFAKMTKGIGSWGWSTVPQKHMKDRRIWFTQAKVIGGGSSINAQIYTRGHAQDYDQWADGYGCTGWGYRDLLPYFRRAEANDRFNDEFHGIDGPLGVSVPRATLPICDAFIRAGQQFGMPYNPDFNGHEQAGVGYYQLTQRHARRSSAAVAYLKPAEGRPNLTVMTGTHVLRLVVEKGCAVGLDILRGGRQERVHAAREVIVSSGSIGSPRLLMLSGIGPPDHLHDLGIPVELELPGVGMNLQDHLDICTIAELTGPHSYDGWDKPHKTVWAGLQYLLFQSGPAAASLFETGGFWYADLSATHPDIQFHLGQGSGIEKGIAKINGAGITLNSAYLRPRSRGTVRLADSDPMSPPLIDPNYWSDPHDMTMALRGLEMARDILSQPALSGYVRKEVLPGPDVTSRAALLDYACKMAKTDHHPVGTCKMGAGDMAVVDRDLRVHGIDRLRVCDASIMPQITSSNTNAPTIMIAEKGADLILDRTPLASVDPIAAPTGR
ncbi:GMC family oxidoreductase N-terminal domain-containing protein [uncultured Roseobacter sp.]|uniref:GMC family oxidoreductase n=1 Tax=uncultured Roseobacter sp. TaxID=114847 RepID=UPI00260A9E16|nr:GMC family oxidoreductase N-terminal domain-containing protein [uncultured Roseobacter sp.]